MTVKFRQEKVTKNTIKFVEILENELDTAKIGTLYVQKTTLKEIGWQDGKVLTVDLAIED
ncbi:MAG: hypothetical protein IKM88_15470 [Lachnospiraceae bacterium]|nr:hypothetical protein [Lachnospiraceae bacterium]